MPADRCLRSRREATSAGLARHDRQRLVSHRRDRPHVGRVAGTERPGLRAARHDRDQAQEAKIDRELRISRFPPPDQNGAVRFIEVRVNRGSIILIAPHINQDAEPVACSPTARSRTRECRIKKHRPVAARFLNRSGDLAEIVVMHNVEKLALPGGSIPASNFAANRSRRSRSRRRRSPQETSRDRLPAARSLRRASSACTQSTPRSRSSPGSRRFSAVKRRWMGSREAMSPDCP